jgi:hypothetical protein
VSALKSSLLPCCRQVYQLVSCWSRPWNAVVRSRWRWRCCDETSVGSSVSVYALLRRLCILLSTQSRARFRLTEPADWRAWPVILLDSLVLLDGNTQRQPAPLEADSSVRDTVATSVSQQDSPTTTLCEETSPTCVASTSVELITLQLSDTISIISNTHSNYLISAGIIPDIDRGVATFRPCSHSSSSP